MLQERDALHHEVMELEKAEPLVQAATRLLDYLSSKQDPLCNPVCYIYKYQ